MGNIKLSMMKNNRGLFILMIVIGLKIKA